MRVKKRNGSTQRYNSDKVRVAISNASESIGQDIPKFMVDRVVSRVENTIEGKSIVHTSEISTIVENELMRTAYKDVARAYIENRHLNDLVQEVNTTDTSIIELLAGTNEYWNKENSNKNAKLTTTLRDYIAGITSTDIARRILLPKNAVKAHDAGIIHIHDMDYIATPRNNCNLCNLEDMLDNGTVINGIKIEQPHKFITAMTIATQIITAVSSAQYGGITVTMAHLAKYVRMSKKKYYDEYIKRGLDSETADKFAQLDTKKEVEDGVQTFNYQVNSMSSTNGQAPFLTVYLDIEETEEYREDLAMIIEEFLNQRIEGMKNEDGVNVTIAFPKLVYALSESNIHEDSDYWYLTALAAKCTAKRLVPDYVSKKKMQELKVNKFGNGDVYPPMGCVDYNETVSVSDKSDGYDANTVFIGDLFTKLETQKCELSTLHEIAIRNADSIENEDDKKKFLDNYYLVYSGSYFNYWAQQFMMRFGRKPTNEDYRHIVGVNFASMEEMRNRGMNLDLVSMIDSYLELRTIDVLKHNRIKYERNKTITDNNGQSYVASLYLPEFRLCIDVNGKESSQYDNTVPMCVKKGPSYSSKKKNVFDENDLDIIELNEDEILANDYSVISSFIGKNLKLVDYTETEELYREHESNQRTKVIDLVDKCIYKYVKDINGRYVRIRAIIRNSNVTNWVTIHTSNGSFTLTTDHPLLIDGKVVEAGTLVPGNYLTDENGKHLYIDSIEYSNRQAYSYDVETDSHTFVFSGIQSHNCRSFLTPDRIKGNPAKALNYDPNKPKYYGRFNAGIVTLSLPDVALSSRGNIDEFWRIFEERTELCHSVLKYRLDSLAGNTIDSAPILWKHGAFARLEDGDEIANLLKGGYATISLGYAGLYECVKYMTGHSHTDEIGKEFGMQVMQALNDKCNQWKKAEDVDYSIYGTPIESTTYKFAKCLKNRFGNDVFEKLDGKDRDFITNSYHVFVEESINPFDKITLEAEYQALSPGGCISYIETADLNKNIEAALEVMKFIYENIAYAELNTKSDYCQECGSTDELEIVDKDGQLVFRCKHCGNDNQQKLNYARRVCGYISTNEMNNGRMDEIQNRYVHLDNHLCK